VLELFVGPWTKKRRARALNRVNIDRGVKFHILPDNQIVAQPARQRRVDGDNTQEEEVEKE
jgi:hypothetical protein